jgi:hypothetical protein
MRTLTLSLALALAACSAAPESAKHQKELDDRNAALLKQHNEIWALMGLSPAAKDELNKIVLAVSGQLHKNKYDHPAEFKKAMEVKRTPGETMTHEAYLANHKRRFDVLKISDATQSELFKAAEFVWSALHDPDAATKFSEEQRKVARTINDMMKQLNGPPPCCDDNIFERAKAQ